MCSFSYSILFSDFLLSRGTSSTTIAWIFNLHIFLWNAIGVFTGPLVKEFGFRRVSLSGSFFVSFFTFSLTFVDSLLGLFVSFALVGEVCVCMCVFCVNSFAFPLTVSSYFLLCVS